MIDRLLHPVDSPVHRRRPEHKLLATLAFVVVVVLTPRPWFAAFAVELAAVVLAAAAARLPATFVLRRLRWELPFVAFAVFLPIVGAGPRADILGVSLSEPGLWAAWNVVAKGSLGVLAAVVLAATTPVPDLLRGLERLHVPRVVVAIAGFMARYLDLIVADAARMRIARMARGHDPRWLWQARAIAASAGTLFVRTYERGERVHVAMLSRGFDGTMPDVGRSERRP